MRALLVDDEPPARDRLKRLLRDHPDVTCVGEAGDGIAALTAIDELRPDVVFLDVQMPELDGLGVASALPENGPAIVFATAHDEHAVRAFELAAIDYLLKPIAKDRLATALSRVRAGKAAPMTIHAERIAVRSGAKFVVVDVRDVSAVVADAHYATILARGRELLSEESLDRIMARLDPRTFFRAHRSAIVNVDHIEALERESEATDRKYVAIVKGATRVPIARDRLADLKARLGIA